MKDIHPLLAALCTLLALATGCASYTVPGRAADLSVFMHDGKLDPVRETDDRGIQDLSVADILERRPMAAFPTGLAVVRVQSPDYSSATYQAVPQDGVYRVMSVRDIEGEEDFATLGGLPGIQGVAPMNRLLVPQNARDDVDLRRAAAQLRADLLLIYTLDTTFSAERDVEPLDTISLGLLNSKRAEVHTTASAILVDTRTGYLYATAEGTAHHKLKTSLWSTSRDVDRTRLRTEKEAFGSLVSELVEVWRGVSKTYGIEDVPEQ